MDHRVAVILVAGLVACGGSAGPEWAGTIDTLPGGQVVVTNPATGIWGDTLPWQVVEELRIGAEDGDGPEVFGRIGVLMEDAGRRIWALESTEQQFKVFDAEGRFIRTVGRQGGGPGEMRQAAGAALLGRDQFLVVDMSGARISRFDTSGTYLEGYPISGGFQMYPWPGRVDRAGRLYNAIPYANDGEFRMAMVRYDSTMTPTDTLLPPRWDSGLYFDHSSNGNSIRASIPHAPSLYWRLTAEGDFWSFRTDSYTLVRLAANGDTTRVATKPFTPTAVSSEEKDSAIARLKWFTDQGGKVDRGRIPDVKPAAQGFQVAEDGYLWVAPILPDTTTLGRVFEIFDPEGRYLGRLRL
ncbi:MAG: hypothetical protein KJZ47_08250, partial [Gemmatimonadales bacterium]|nr:hypothetical protein [Gemmatimonadales bacterium]